VFSNCAGSRQCQTVFEVFQVVHQAHCLSVHIHSVMENSHASSAEEVLDYFSTDDNNGLSDDHVKRNQDKYGPNGKILCVQLLHNLQFTPTVL